MKPKTGEIKFKGLGRVEIVPIEIKKVMDCKMEIDRKMVKA